MNLPALRPPWLPALLAAVLLALALLVGGLPAAAQGPVEPPAAPAMPAAEKITAAEIEARRRQAEEASDLVDELKKRIAELYRQAAEHLAQSEQQAALANGHKSAADGAQARLAQLRSELESLHPQEPPATGGSLGELEQQLSAKDLQLKELKAAQARLDAEPAARLARRAQLRAQLSSAPQRLEELRQQLDAPAPPDEPPHLTLARRTETLARRVLLQRQSPAMANELARYDAEEAVDLLRVERDLLARRIALAQREFDLINEAVRRRRKSEAREAVRRAQEEVIYAQPVLKSHAEKNQVLAERAQSLAVLIGQTEGELRTAKERLEDVQRQMAQTQKKVESVGLTGAIGMMLRKQRTELPDVGRRRQHVAARTQEFETVQLALFEYDDERSRLSTPEPLVEQIMESNGPLLDEGERECLQAAAEHVLHRKREYLDALIRSYNVYFDALVELDTTERELISATEQYQNYIDQRVLWIRSARPLYTDFRLDESDFQLISPAAWREVGAGLGKDFTESFPAWFFVGLALAILFWLGVRCRRNIETQGEIARRGSCCEYIPTLRAAMATLVLALPVPIVLLFLARRIAPFAGREGLAWGLVHGLSAVAMTWFLLQLTRQICREGGLGEAHFGWSASATRQMRGGLRVLMLLGLPVLAIAATFRGIDPEHARDVLERSSYLLLAAMVGVFVGRVFSPSTGIFKEYLAYHPESWLARLKHVWYWGLMLIPAALAGLSLFGYHYTARQLAARMYITAALVLAVVVVQAMMFRLALVARRKLAIAEARRRRAENAELTAAMENTAAEGPPIAVSSEPPVDLKTHSLQIQRLIATGLAAVLLVGLWWVWSDVVPALGFLNRFVLWTTTVNVAEQVAGAAGEAVVVTREKIMTVTLAHVGLAAIIAVVTIIAGRNAPGLLEISVLQRLPLENSVRYAITTLASYAILLVGIIVGCQTIGLRWSQIQWLATALTFGLAFGLQEMFANFVAGLIILFERPIRVGDVVTVDDTTGVVSKIRIRATTITNWDRKEYIVPNKEFITGKLLNWTLSDQINRILINVGVAYGSNTRLVQELLLKVADGHPLTLDNPRSMATFEGFGDSSLNFCLRTFLPSMENRLVVIHDLHTAIDEEFRKAGIEISFPQRDLHIRTLPKEIASLAKDGEKKRGAAKRG